MATTWNQNPSQYRDKLGAVEPASRALRAFGVYSGVALAAAACARYGVAMLRLLHLPYLGVIGTLLLITTSASALAAAWTVGRWRESRKRAQAQASLRPLQRALLGLPPAAPARPGAGPVSPAPVTVPAALATPLTPAQRVSPLVSQGRALASDATPRALMASAATTRSSIGTSPATGRTPYSGSGRVVATPRDLRPYLEGFGRPPMSPLSPSDQAGGFYGADGAAGGGYEAAAQQQQAGYGAYQDQQENLSAGAALPLGRDAPTYRPSLMARKAATAAAPESLQPTADQEMTNMLTEVLGMGGGDEDGEEEELGEEGGGYAADAAEDERGSGGRGASRWARVRGLAAFMGSQYPGGTSDGGDEAGMERTKSGWDRLRAAVRGGGAFAAAGAQRRRLPGQRREPLQDLMVWTERLREWMAFRMMQPLVQAMDSAEEEANQMLRTLGAAATQQLPPLRQALGLYGGGGGGSLEDAEGLARQLLGACAALPGAQQEQLRPLIRALHRYEQLLMLLKGRKPADLLPPAPPGYVASRVEALARGTCMQGFEWNGGGEWQGRPWTSELPTDSAVAFYLFAAFLDAPAWEFQLQPGGEGRHTPLYLGQVRSRPPPQFSALLAYRPDKPGPGVTAVIGAGLTSREPTFSLLAEGRLVTLTGRDAAFHALLMFVQYHAAKRHGLIGRAAVGDDALRLDLVIAPGELAPTVPQRVWNWWFPPYRPA